MAAHDPVRRRLDMDSADLLDDVAVRARIVSTRNVACEELLRSQITLYEVRVQQNDLAHVVRRRYSEFRQLHDALAREFGPSYANLIAGLLPPKLVIGNADAELIAERMTALDAYLSAVLAVPALSRSARVGAFLALPAVLPRASVAGGWLLTGSWTPDEARSRDTLEPLLQAMGTPWAIRRMLAGVKIVTTYEHAAGGSLSERAVSSAGEGAPNTILLDGVAHPSKIGGRDATVCAVERPEAGVVRIETTLPGGAGRIVDERRVLGGGGELERTIELTLEGKPPIKLHRLLVRTPESASPRRWVGAGSSPPAGDSVTVEVVVPLPPPPPLARRSLLRREAHVTARFVLAEGTSWADPGHEVAAEQFAVPPPPPPREAIVTKPEPPPLVVEESANALVVRGGEGGAAFRISIGKASGAIDEWIVGGRRLVLGGSARPALWRAPTDNDNGGAMNSLPRPHKAVLAGSHMVWWLWIGFWLMWNGLIYGQLSYADTWRREGLHAMRPRRRAVSVGVAGPHAVELCVASELSGDPTAEAPAPRVTAAPADEATATADGARATHSLRVRVHSDGEVVLLRDDRIRRVRVAAARRPRL